MAKQTKVVGVVIREGVCQKSDNDIIYGALFGRAMALERTLQNKRSSLCVNELKALQDEYERTFALTERFRRN